MNGAERSRLQLGLRANLGQFALLVAVNSLVGAMVGQERTVVPLLAEEAFGLRAASAAMTFIVVFGLAKATTNLFAGALSDRFGRKPVLIAGWLCALPVPLLIIVAPGWEWVVLANALLGVSQGLTWTTTVIMKIDLVGPARRGLAMGLNEAAGYGAVALAAFGTGLLAQEFGLRPVPFLAGLAVAAVGLGASVLFVCETKGHADLESSARPSSTRVPLRQVMLTTTLREPALSAASQAGFSNNLNDGMAWGLLPLYYAASGLSVVQIGVLAALYPAVWGLLQPLSGALSDRLGRKVLIVGGLFVQAVAIGFLAVGNGFEAWAAAAIILGAGTAMAYPTLLAAIGDVAHPAWRASALGVYRFWRDLGFAAGALLSGIVADLAGFDAAIWAIAGITALSAGVVAVRMYETHPRGVDQRLTMPS